MLYRIAKNNTQTHRPFTIEKQNGDKYELLGRESFDTYDQALAFITNIVENGEISYVSIDPSKKLDDQLANVNDTFKTTFKTTLTR